MTCYRLFANMTKDVPDWSRLCMALPLLPSRAAQKDDYDNLRSLRNEQARYVRQLYRFQDIHSDAGTETELEDAKHMLREEYQKLTLLDSRLDIYYSALQEGDQVAFNEQRLPNDHTSHNEPRVNRAIVTFRQAMMLINNVSLKEIYYNKRLVVDVRKFSRWNHKEKYYLLLDVFKNGTMDVEKKKIVTGTVQIKYFDASWPAAPVAHRVQPTHGYMNTLSETKDS